jgi:hypothetical protein
LEHNNNNNEVKEALNALIFAVMFLTLFVILLPVAVKLMDGRAGKALYGVLTVGAVAVAFRLRAVARRM